MTMYLVTGTQADITSNNSLFFMKLSNLYSTREPDEDGGEFFCHTVSLILQ